MIMIATVATTRKPTAIGVDPPARKARTNSSTMKTSPSTVATLLTTSQAGTPGPTISYAWYFEMSTIQAAGRMARATISGVAQMDSICRPRSDCQVSGENRRDQPPMSRLIRARPTPTTRKARPAGLRSGGRTGTRGSAAQATA